MKETQEKYLTLLIKQYVGGKLKKTHPLFEMLMKMKELHC